MFYTEVNTNRSIYKWVYYLLSSLPWAYYTTQTAIPSIVGSEVESIFIPYPSKEEQGKIVEFLDEKIGEIDVLISEKQRITQELERYKNSIIYEYVTGKKEV